jgi:hypothetical protein
MKSHDAEALSAYLDGQLSPPETRRLEQRIHSDPELRELLADLRFGRAALKQVPRRRVPRNFVLRPSMAALRGPVPRSVPVLRFASVFAMLLLVATFAINSLATQARATPAAAPLPAYGLGGAGGTAPSPEALLKSNAAEPPQPHLNRRCRRLRRLEPSPCPRRHRWQLLEIHLGLGRQTPFRRYGRSCWVQWPRCPQRCRGMHIAPASAASRADTLRSSLLKESVAVPRVRFRGGRS